MEHFHPSGFNMPQQSVPPYSEDCTNVDLNQILQQALSIAKDIVEPHRIIIRCDSLPTVFGNPYQFKRLFTGILQLVLSDSLSGSRQFLYVRCEEEVMDKDVLSASGCDKTYIIQFHSNIILDAYWQTAYRPILADCEQIAKTYSGNLAYTQLNSGSLFTLRLAGKSL